MSVSIETRIRDVQRTIARLCESSDAARNVRVGPTEHRAYDVLVGVHGADAVNLVKLIAAYPDYGFYMCDSGGPCINVYIPTRSPPAVSVLRAGSKGALIAGVVACALGLWTVASQ